MQKTTLFDVAKKAGVCTMTVSRVINQHAGLKPSTVAKVNQAIAALGYRQNEAARLMKGKRARLIGYVVPDLSDQFFATCAHRVQQLATGAGYMTLVASSDRNPELEREQVRMMADRMPSGIIIVSSRTDNAYLQPLQKAGLVLGAFSRPLKTVDADLVVSENYMGAEWATRHLLEHGHKQIACLAPDADVYGLYERARAYRDTMSAAGLMAEEKLDCTSAVVVKQWLKARLKSADRPIAVFTLNHRCTLFFYEAARSLGLSIPKDAALVGFDDFEVAPLLHPPLTAVAQSVGDLAQRTFDLLLHRIQNRSGESAAAVRVSIPVTPKIRSSCGCETA